MLAMHENVQHRLAEEIDEVFGEYKDLIVDYEKLSELKYVEMVIKETLRLFSPATGKRSFTFPATLLAGYCNLFKGIFREVKADVDLGSVGMGEARLRPFSSL
jgi:cytochrome P450